MKAGGLLTTIGCLVIAVSASAQNKPASGLFDGKWVGETAKCSPTSNTYRFNGLTVTKSAFSWSATDRGRQVTCKVSINGDGSFESAKDCAFQLTGKFEAKKATISIKTSERLCDVVARHE